MSDSINSISAQGTPPQSASYQAASSAQPQVTGSPSTTGAATRVAAAPGAADTSSPAAKLELSPASGGASSTSSSSTPMTMAEAASAYQNYLSSLPSNLQLQPDSAAGMVIMKIVNPVTQKVIRQLPPEDVIEQAKYLRAAEKANHSGILLDQSL